MVYKKIEKGGCPLIQLGFSGQPPGNFKYLRLFRLSDHISLSFQQSSQAIINLKIYCVTDI